jgi:biotin operon repressor
MGIPEGISIGIPIESSRNSYYFLKEFLLNPKGIRIQS